MSRKSYAAALDEVLEPMGFRRQGTEWSREVGTVIEVVDLQKSSIAGTTANLWSYDDAVNDLLKKAVPWKAGDGFAGEATRIGRLMDDPCDRWWKNDPNGPRELAQAIRLHAESFFAGRRSLEDQARLHGRAQQRWYPSCTGSRIYLALTLYRMGELEEACRALSNPPKTAPPSALAMAESVRQWLGCSPVE